MMMLINSIFELIIYGILFLVGTIVGLVIIFLAAKAATVGYLTGKRAFLKNEESMKENEDGGQENQT